MALEILHTSPQPTDFIPLEEHQSTTPGTFFGGKPVLHAHHSGLTLAIPRDQLQLSEAISRFTVADSQDGSAADGEKDAPAMIEGVDVWVGSERLILFQTTSTHGIALPYPAIGIQALQRFQGIQSLHMQVNLNEQSHDDDDDADFEILLLNLLPPPNAPETLVKELYDACAACQELHPDPIDEDDEDGEESGGFPGEGGWITSENMGEFVDAEGNFTIPVYDGSEGLGAGAGHIRARDEADGVNGHGGEDGGEASDETKWRRTD